MADEKTIYVTFEFQGNLDRDVDGVTNSLDRLEIEASKVLKKMAEGSNLVSRGFRVQADAINKLPGPLNTAASGVGLWGPQSLRDRFSPRRHRRCPAILGDVVQLVC